MKHHKLLVAVAALFLGSAAVARAQQNPGVVPIDANAHGQSYGQLAAAWWKWAFETPAPVNAVLDPTGANCASAQTDHVWFLAGTFFGGSVTRTCTVPTGTFLFFPLANDLYGAFLTDPDDQRTEAFVRSQTTCIVGAQVTAEIDGVAVTNPRQYIEQSPLFTIHFPTDNVFGLATSDVPDLTLDPSVDRGYYLYLNPLPAGPHTIHFTATAGSSCAADQDVTYQITVAGG